MTTVEVAAGQAAPADITFFSDELMTRLGRVLAEDGRLAGAQISDMLGRSALTGEPLDRLLIKERLLEERDVLAYLSKISGIPFRPIAEFKLEPEAVAKIQARAALRYQVMPVRWDGATLTLATARVPELTVVDSLRMLLGCAVAWVLCPESDVVQSLKHFYGLGAETVDAAIEEKKAQEVTIEETDLALDSADPGIVKFVNQVIAEAIRMDATDIHIEPFEDLMRIRFRIDGLLQKIPIPTGVDRLQRSIASAIKIMAQMNIAERRKPHDGRIKVKMGEDEFDLRVSVLPTRHGETVCLRLLNRRTMFIDLEHLGLIEEQRPLIEYLTAMPHGIILITGPTGSGKTTTLYAALSTLNTEDVKIITVEDPVEYQMEGINQMQVHHQIGLDFAASLRSILRHDPDIVLIGEIRDVETAQIAVQASLTGHLVFSTLHTNDAPSAITRLIDMGVEPYLVSSCLEGVIAQRLVRKVCTKCPEPSLPDDVILDEIKEIYAREVADATFRRGRGCPNCNFTGYRGRVALFEIMLIDEQLRHMIARSETASVIRRQAMKNGMATLRQSGWRRVMDGTTTPEEVLRVARRFDILKALEL